MQIKWLQFQRIMKTNNKYIIVDPEGEYAPLFNRLCPELISVVNLGSGTDKINCMEMVKNYGIDDGGITTGNPVGAKSQFIMSLLNQADPTHPISLEEKSILDRCVKISFERYTETEVLPTLSILHDIILEQPEPESKKLALKLELFTTGSLNMFGEESTVDMYSKRITIFNLYGMKEIQKPIGLFVLADAIINMVTLDWEHGGVTYIDFDEAQVLLSDPNTSDFFDSAYRQWRKRNGIPNAISQNASVFLNNTTTTTMLANSEIVFMMSQSPSDLAALTEYFSLSDEQTKWLKKSRAGAGLFKYGDVFIPFNNRIPDNTTIYKLFSTKRNEGVFGSENNRQ